MSASLLLKAFVNERLTAAAEEIFQFFEGTIAKYEEEASSSKQENERLRGLLLEFVSNNKEDNSQSSVCKRETQTEQQHCEQEPSISVHQGEPEPRHIKEEAHELWATQPEEEEQAAEFEDTDVLYLPQSSVWEETEQADTKLSLKSHTQNCDGEEAFEETKSVQFLTLVQNKLVQEGRESEEFPESFTSDQSQTSFMTSRETIELPHLTSHDFQCYLCEKSFTSSHHLINHAFRLHSNDASALCAVCGSTSESKESLNAHLKSHKGTKCLMCDKHFSRSTALTEHMTSHTGVKLHRCHVCGKECSRKGDLKIHMRIHTGEKPFCCSYCCKSFTHSGHLRKHMRSHTGERPHRCDICGRAFLQSGHLKYHLTTHNQKC